MQLEAGRVGVEIELIPVSDGKRPDRARLAAVLDGRSATAEPGGQLQSARDRALPAAWRAATAGWTPRSADLLAIAVDASPGEVLAS